MVVVEREKKEKPLKNVEKEKIKQIRKKESAREKVKEKIK